MNLAFEKRESLTMRHKCRGKIGSKIEKVTGVVADVPMQIDW